MVYADFKDLNPRTTVDKLLRDKAFNIAKNPKYDGYQRGLVFTSFTIFFKTVNNDMIYCCCSFFSDSSRFAYGWNHTILIY